MKGRTIWADSNESHGEALLSYASPSLLVIKCFAPDGVLVGNMNGFIYQQDGPRILILTAGHCVGFEGATHYTAKGSDQAEGDLEIRLLKVGPHTEGPNGEKVFSNDGDLDCAVFEATKTLPSCFRIMQATLVEQSDLLFITWFKGGDVNALSFSFGTVSSSGLDNFTTTISAGEEFLGAPIFNDSGRVVGMAIEGGGKKAGQVVGLHTGLIDYFVQYSGAPNLPGLVG